MSAFDLNSVKECIKQVNGKMKVSRVLLHGAPGVGKNTVRRLMLNYPLKDEHSSKGDLVRPISTSRMMSTDGHNLEEVDKTNLIRMIQKELKMYISKTQENPVKSSSSDNVSVNTDDDADNTSSVRVSQPSLDEILNVPSRTPEVLTDVTKLDSIDPCTPSLFECQFIYLVDLGGQPLFFNLLPRLFQSDLDESPNHIIVIPLNEKLNTKPRNCVDDFGKKMQLPDSLMPTHLQLVERVCQLAKTSKARVMVVGTRLNLEDKEEPLSKKNMLLSHLLEKYHDNLVPNKGGEVIFAINAMAPEKEKREEYSKMLRSLILENFCSGDGKMIPLLWMALELELSHYSRKPGDIVDKAHCNKVAKALGVKDVNDALTFFTKTGVHYYYPEALPGIVFNSVGAIFSRLLAIVKALFLFNAQNKSSQDFRKLQESGMLTRKYLFNLLSRARAPINQLFSNEDFLKLILYLRIAFNIDNNTLFIPGLLPVDSIESRINIFHSEPLAFFWYDEHYQKVRILPQSFFHALIAELFRNKESIKLYRSWQSRSSITIKVILESNGKECKVCLVNRVFWLEAFIVKHDFSSDNISCLMQIIQSCSQSVLKQLNMANSLDDLQYGLLCPAKTCGIQLPHLSTLCGPDFVFKCLEKMECEWKEEDDARLFWARCINQQSELKIFDIAL